MLFGSVEVQSEEDLALKQQLELYVERVQDSDPGLQKVALDSMRWLLYSTISVKLWFLAILTCRSN